MPRLVVASASKPSDCSSLAVPASHGLGRSRIPGRACRSRKIWPFSACVRMTLFLPRQTQRMTEHHRLVAHRAEAQAQKVERVVLVELPRPLGALLGLLGERALDVARGEIHPRLLGQGGIAVARRALAVAAAVHVIDQPADILADQVGLERPRGVGVAEHRGEVGHVRVHHALVDEGLGRIDGAAVDGKLRLAERHQHQPGRRHDQVGRKLGAGFELQAGLGEGFDVVGDDRDLAARGWRGRNRRRARGRAAGPTDCSAA